MSDGFNLPSTWDTLMNLLLELSLTAFSLIVMCLRPFVVKVWDQSTQAMLSLKMEMVLGMTESWSSRSIKMFLR